VNKATGHEPQTDYPQKRAWLDVASYPHVKADRSRIEESALGPLSELNYFNVCPFRSNGIDELTDNDWRLGISAFFNETMEFLAPPVALFQGTSGLEKLREHGLADFRPVVVTRSNKRSTGFVGWLRTGTHQTPFYAIPRPRDLHSEAEKALLWNSILAETP